MPIQIGQQLGSLEVTALIGRGGMGEVYRAHDTKLKRDVAVKTLPDEFLRDADRVSRFQREAEVLASLNHPNIAAIYDLEEVNGSRYLVLELVEGETLAERIARGPVPIDDALDIAKNICEALEAAHEKGIIHRDLKPSNIKIAPGGQVKVLDFGLAKAISGAARATTLSNSPTLVSGSIGGAIIGTASYMSPEQARGREADARSDIFAFGCVLFEMLTGRRAFDGDEVSEILASVLKSDPDFSLLHAKLNPRLLDLLRRCLQKNPRDRWHAAADVRLELQSSFQAGSAPDVMRPVVPRPLWRRAVPVVVAMVLSAALGGIAVWQLRPLPTGAVARFTVSLPEVQQANYLNRSVAISPDGTEIVYEANRRLYLRLISEPDARPIGGTEDTLAATIPVFSPDGRFIVFYAAGSRSLKKIPVTGGVATTLAAIDPIGVCGVSWTRDGLVFGQGFKSIVQVPENGGEAKVILKAGTSDYVGFPSLLPGGKTLLFGLYDTLKNRRQVFVQSLASGQRNVILDQSSTYQFPTDARYLDTGHLVYEQGGILFAAPFNLRALQVASSPVPVIQGIRTAFGADPIFSISSAGSLIYVPGPVTASLTMYDLAVADQNGFVERLKLPPRSYETPRISPDGKRVAFEIDEGNDANIWIYNLSGTSAMSRLTFGGKNKFPIWSPDGQRIAFQSDREGDAGIFWQRADGSGVAERLTKAGKNVSHAPESWAPNGDVFLFRAIEGSNVSLWSFSLREKKAERFSGVQSLDLTSAAFSPDGHWVAYNARDQGQNLDEVYVQPFPPTGARYQLPISRDNHHPAWARDGKSLFYIPGPGEYDVVTFTATPSVAFGNPVQIRGAVQTYAPQAARQYDITPEGKLLGVVPSEQSQPGTQTAPQITVVLNWFTELQQRVSGK